jgi:hypothetical protein
VSARGVAYRVISSEACDACCLGQRKDLRAAEWRHWRREKNTGRVHALWRIETDNEYRVAGVGAMARGKTKDLLRVACIRELDRVWQARCVRIMRQQELSAVLTTVFS